MASSCRRWMAGLGLSTVASSLVVGLSPSVSHAAPANVGLGTAASYSVLGGQTVTNTGTTLLGADLGVSPGTAITGFPPGIAGGATHKGDAHAAQAQSDVVTAYNDVASRAPTQSIAGDIVGRTFTSGVYRSSGPIAQSGTTTLDAQGDPQSVFIFQAASTLITASAANINLINGAQACRVFWQVGSSATLGTNSSFKGTILALTSISVNTQANVVGRALARNGQVSLDDNDFTMGACTNQAASTTTTTTGGGTTTSTTGGGGTTTSTTAGGSAGGTTSTTASGGTTSTTASGGGSSGDATPTTAAPSSGGPTTTATPSSPPASVTSGTPSSPGGPRSPTQPGTPEDFRSAIPASSTDLATTGVSPLLAMLAALAGLLLVVGSLMVSFGGAPRGQLWAD